MATAALDFPTRDAASRRRFGWLEATLVISVLALVGQLAGPSMIRVWQQRPRPGKQIRVTPIVADQDGNQWEMPCWIYFPADYSRDRRFALLLYLHGAGERGNDLTITFKCGLPGMLAAGKALPAVVLSPQCPPGRAWENVKLLAILDWAEAHYAIDPERIYVCGYSMGASGAWRLAASAPERLAAIVPVAGRGDVQDADRLAKLPIWAFHGDQDDIVPLEGSTGVIKAIKDAGGRPRVSILKGEGHAINESVLSRSELYEWMYEQRRGGQH